MKTKYMREEQLKAMIENLKNLNNLLTRENELLKDEIIVADLEIKDLKRELKKLKLLF